MDMNMTMGMVFIDLWVAICNYDTDRNQTFEIIINAKLWLLTYESCDKTMSSNVF